MVNPYVPWLILLSPLAAAFFIVALCLKRPALSGWVALCGILLSLAGSVNLFFESLTNRAVLPYEISVPWIRAGWVELNFGFLLDPLSVLMLLIVTGVGSCIFLYSVGYMHGDSSYPRFFASLSLFAFSMIGIVVSSNLLQLFVFWELVAVSSYLLIGFWFEKPSAADAGNKAFIVNRVGDFGFLIGILLVWVLSGSTGSRTLDFAKLAAVIPGAAQSGALPESLVFAAVLLVFCGVAGKSAQFPLYIWLPDAMEGPTPVSALIHAATMVAAGVYLLCRMFFLVGASPEALHIIAYFGTATAFLAALLAIVQTDIKKVLAYSTVSQLGYMVLALGLGSSQAGMFHLSTHAFFKALLFLGSGAMIHALHTQEIWKMGGLLKSMPVTAVTFLIGTLALCGIWPLSGFFSKDEILALAWGHHPVIFGIALATAGITAFYMTRLCWVAVIGRSRAHGHPHDAPFVMKAPLVVLAVFSAAAGFIGIPQFLAGSHGGHHHPPQIVPILATATALAGIALGTLLYARAGEIDPVSRLPGFVYRTLVRKYWLDEAFIALARVFDRAVAGLFLAFDLRVIIRGLVNGSAQATRGAGSLLRLAQTGRVQNYAALFSFGILALIAFALARG